MEDPPKIGHSVIDAQHVDLYHCIRHLRALAGKRFGHEQVAVLLGQMESMLAKHFATEEIVMTNLVMPADERLAHLGEHQRILAAVAQIRSAHRIEDAASLHQLCEVAQEWVVVHVRNYDERLGRYLRDAGDGELSLSPV